MEIIKRDGVKEEFNLSKIINALKKAFNSCSYCSNFNTDEHNHYYLLKDIEEKINKETCLTVDQVHKIVEESLINFNYKEVYKSYNDYRLMRNKEREKDSLLFKTVFDFIKQTNPDIAHENANKDSSVVSTHRDLLAGLLSKHYALEHILPKEIADAHKEGFIHVHDLDYIISPLTNCCLINYPDMLKKGFRIGNAEIEEPQSIGVAATVLTQIIQAVSSSQYGGQSLAHIDRYLKPYVEKSYKKNINKYLKLEIDKKNISELAWKETEKEVYDAMQTFFYQVNSITSTNGQTPFITISLGLDTSNFGRMITKAYLKIHEKGLGANGTTSVFPKVIFFLQEGINLNPIDINYDLKKLAIKCCVKRIYPDFISVPLNKEVTKAKTDVVTSMGCRSFLSYYEDQNGIEKYNGRFNLGVVSLNLPMYALATQRKLAIMRKVWSKEEVEESFLHVVEKYAKLAYKAHMIRVNKLKNTKAKQNPIMFVEGALARLDPEETTEKLFYNGYASISLGFIGLAETSEVLKGKLDKNFCLKVLQKMKDCCKMFSEESGLSFSVYGTPSESYCYKAAKDIKNKFGYEIISHDYLTNSFHFPVWKESNPFEKWKYEEGFANICSGGHIGYIETNNLKDNLQALESLIDYGYNHIPYFGINQPVDQCFKCNFEGEFKATPKGFSCPSCGNRDEETISVIRRVSGYLSAPNSRPFNKGKMQEVIERVKHNN